MSRVFLLALLALSMGCGSQKSGTSGKQTEVNPPAATGGATFALKDADGAQFNLADYRGKAVLLQFFSTTCGYCKKEAKLLHQEITLNSARSSRIAILGIAVRHSELDVTDWTIQTGVTYPVLLDSDGAVFDQYRVKKVLPTLVYLNPDLTISEVQTDHRKLEKIISTLESLNP